jgi:hypothetical protein
VETAEHDELLSQHNNITNEEETWHLIARPDHAMQKGAGAPARAATLMDDPYQTLPGACCLKSRKNSSKRPLSALWLEMFLLSTSVFPGLFLNIGSSLFHVGSLKSSLPAMR